VGTVDKVETARGLYRLFAQRDDEGLLAVRPGDRVGTDGGRPPQGRPRRGRRHLRRVQGAVGGLRRYRRAVPRRGEFLVALGLYERMHRGTGRSARAEFAHSFELEDGRTSASSSTPTRSKRPRP
jgi:hypothetical protein